MLCDVEEPHDFCRQATASNPNVALAAVQEPAVDEMFPVPAPTATEAEVVVVPCESLLRIAAQRATRSEG